MLSEHSNGTHQRRACGHRQLAVVGHGSEDDGGGEQDSDADPQDLSLFLQHVVLPVEVVGETDTTRGLSCRSEGRLTAASFSLTTDQRFQIAPLTDRPLRR